MPAILQFKTYYWMLGAQFSPALPGPNIIIILTRRDEISANVQINGTQKLPD